MYCDLRSATDPVATISKPATALATLPPASLARFGGLPPWAVIPTGTLVAALGIDRGNFATWRCRGIGPAELPATWFRPAPGRPCYYRVDQVLAWIAARRGEEFDLLTTWRLSLQRDFDNEVADPNEVRKLAALYARAAGPVQGEVRFTPTGFQAYLDSLGSRTDNIPHWR